MKQKAARLLLFLLVNVVFLEGVLRGAAALRPGLAAMIYPPPPRALPSAALVTRPNPAWPEHDQRGYRNPAVRRHAPWVALGDSFTYGLNARLTHTWPQVLGRRMGAPGSVYAIAFGGWGPVQHLALLPQAVALRPKGLLAASYLGNDFYDCFSAVYTHGLAPQLATPNPALARRLKKLEQTTPLEKEILARFVAAFGHNPTQAGPRGLKKWLGHSALFGALKAVKNGLRQRRAAPPSPASPPPPPARPATPGTPALVVFEDKTRPTVFTPDYRQLAVDIRDPRLREGQRVCGRALIALHRRARAKNLPLRVVLIPTKELVYQPLLARQPRVAKRLAFSGRLEEDARDALLASLRAADVPVVDLTPFLQQQLLAGKALYPDSADGHFNETGYAAVAEGVYRAMNHMP